MRSRREASSSVGDGQEQWRSRRAARRGKNHLNREGGGGCSREQQKLGGPRRWQQRATVHDDPTEGGWPLGLRSWATAKTSRVKLVTKVDWCASMASWKPGSGTHQSRAVWTEAKNRPLGLSWDAQQPGELVIWEAGNPQQWLPLKLILTALKRDGCFRFN